MQMIKGSFYFLVFPNVSSNGLSNVIVMKIIRSGETLPDVMINLPSDKADTLLSKKSSQEGEISASFQPLLLKKLKINGVNSFQPWNKVKEKR